jgi:hypothetical protein
MRSLVLCSFLVVGCAAPPAPEANGYDVQLYFDGVPAGEQTLVGTSATISVKRIEQRTDQCTTGACDPISEMPIALLSAKCDDFCTVTQLPSQDGSVALAATADRAGMTTLHVRVRSLLDGAEWEDGYPLAFRDHTITDFGSPVAIAPNWVDKKASEK